MKHGAYLFFASALVVCALPIYGGNEPAEASKVFVIDHCAGTSLSYADVVVEVECDATATQVTYSL